MRKISPNVTTFAVVLSALLFMTSADASEQEQQSRGGCDYSPIINIKTSMIGPVTKLSYAEGERVEVNCFDGVRFEDPPILNITEGADIVSKFAVFTYCRNGTFVPYPKIICGFNFPDPNKVIPLYESKYDGIRYKRLRHKEMVFSRRIVEVLEPIWRFYITQLLADESLNLPNSRYLPKIAQDSLNQTMQTIKEELPSLPFSRKHAVRFIKTWIKWRLEPTIGSLGPTHSVKNTQGAHEDN